MLVLSRKIGQEIVLGGEIRVRVLEVRGNRVRLGFDAPDSVGIQRAELTAGAVPTRPADDQRMAAGPARSQMLVPSV